MLWEGTEEIEVEVQKYLKKKVVNVLFLCPYYLHETSRGQVSITADAE